ncbi:MAG: class I SAM-dependent methyltransferase [Bacillota bacterium]|nr:class I SAM-dependent methyltransferase [Bacillota bacterium]MDP4171673.1 class I SAM-dependent methyltransferase [Bacillota bacterium]
MGYKGASVYDNHEFFESYLARRNREMSPNNIIEKPVLLELLGDVTGKQVVDLGCGEATIGQELLQHGCFFYEGVEGSNKMVEKAKEVLAETNSIIHHSSIESWDFPGMKYDLAISRMALHYLEDLAPVFTNIYRSLKDNGQFVFSVQHPVLTSSVMSASHSPKRTNWIVDDYFDIGERKELWINKEVIKYHRTVEEYFRLLKGAGFKIEDLRECSPTFESFENEEEYIRRKRIPLFLIFSCNK